MTPLQRILAPRSVAVIGASDRQGNRGGTAAALMRKFGFAGDVYPVHPTAETVAGYPAVRSIAELPSDVDVAIIGLGAANVSGVARELHEAGIPGAIAWAGGFSENGPEGERLQAELAEVVRSTGVRLIGPNCLGVVNTAIGFTGTFATWLRGTDELLTSGIAMVSQSGGLAANAHAWSQESGIGFRYMISTGNEVDLGVVDLLETVVEDPGTEIVLAYLEGVRDGARFAKMLRRARELGKPVLVLKVGHSAASAAAIAAHTGALAGETRVWDALLEAEGAVQVHSVEQLLETAGYLHGRAGLPPLRGRRVVIMGHGGGAGVLASDQCALAGLEVPALSPETRAALAPTMPEIASTKNPVDLTPEAYVQEKWRSQLSSTLDAVAKSGEADVLLTQFSVGEIVYPEDIAGPVIDLHRKGELAVAVYSRGATAEAVKLYTDAGLHVFDDQRVAVETLGLLTGPIRTDDEVSRAILAAAPELVTPVVEATLPAVSSGDVVAEHEVHRLLAEAGFDVLRGETAHSAEEAGALAEKLGFPVVLKALSPQITHRAAVGLVRLSVGDRATAEQTYRELAARTEALGADLLGVLVQQSAVGGTELLVSGFRDPVFGPVVSCGAGGVATELIDDVSFALAPLDEAAALALLRRLRTTGKSKGLSLEEAGAQAVAFLVRFSRFVESLPWPGFVLELNPVSVTVGRAVALDGLLVVSEAGQ
ncbi:acetate--CoA ligase family protein [Amycolatopsis sp. DSM 110486]|uniref:acetate--CoA ligase family protein n=1 Tax=Amycolatopsis sp. DSM 110486 TaxID=2865832 RepID=UPI001C6A7EF0|nr:acetate--CoA ligase family protein [Amycolatopsis sp. DSM 110486]QYN17884.1 acetate--CoA ligase family protein [Amycolatopsis sp. DSM 110486]